ncbi:MAG: MFS transporter [Gammaproteobacteria bacterium]
MELVIKNKLLNLKAIIAWGSYDWGISAFPVIVTTFVIATYFTSEIAVNEIVGTHQWGNAMALAGIIIAILSPISGAIADYGGHRKYWLGAFTSLLIISSALLWYAYPGINSVNFTLACVILGTIGLNIGMVFYNALLPGLAPADYVGRISGLGWGLGYFGGLVVLLIAFYAFVSAKPAWLDVAAFEQIRICGPLVAVWTLLFVLPLFWMVPDYSASRYSMWQAIRGGSQEFISTLKTIRQQKTIFTFLLAQMIYTDGLNTLFAFGGIYAAGTFNMTLSEVLVFGIVLNAFAGLGSIVFSWLDDFLSSKFTILLSLAFLVILVLGLVLVTSKSAFWILACLLSLFIGPVQSSSRSLMTHLIPKEKATEMFGFYVLSGKVTTFIGPWLFGFVTFQFNSQRVGMASTIIFFLIGASILWFIRPQPLSAVTTNTFKK